MLLVPPGDALLPDQHYQDGDDGELDQSVASHGKTLTLGLRYAKWRIILSQRAHMRRAAAAKVQEEEESRDLERFRELLRHGAPSHGFIVLLGLNTFDLNGLLRSVERGLPFRA